MNGRLTTASIVLVLATLGARADSAVMDYVDAAKNDYQTSVATPVRNGRAGFPYTQVDRIAMSISFDKAMKAAASDAQRAALVKLREKFTDCRSAAAYAFDELENSYVERVNQCVQVISDAAANVVASQYQ